MKTLLLKLGCFFSILLLVKLSFVVFYGDRFVYPEAGTNRNKYELAYRKTEFAKEEYDAVFIGSSRTALGISPTYFDFLTKKTKTYNFGIISGMPPKTFDWCEELIESKPSLRYVFFELSGGFAESTGGDDENNRLLAFFKPSIPRREYEEIYYDFKLPLQNIPLEKFLAQQSVPLSKIVSPEKVQLAYLRNVQIENGSSASIVPLNEDYWSRVSDLINLAEAKQIRLYFFVPPRVKTDRELEQIRPIYQKLEERYKLRAAHTDKALYQIDLSLDNTHLNYGGAKKFTELLAEAFDKHDK